MPCGSVITRAMAGPGPAPPPPHMVNLAAQATIIAPNPMLQGALMMQQMQGESISEFHQFFAAGARSSLLGPVPMGMSMKNPHMGFPARHYHPHTRYYNNNNVITTSISLWRTTSGVSAMPASEQLSGERQAFTPGLKDMAEGKAASGVLEGGQEEGKEGGDAANKFYCYICTITCHNQQDFQSHMNSLVHQQRMMEIQHMSSACLVTLMPRVQESLQGGRRDKKRPGLQRWCATCQIHYTSTVMDHRRTNEHKLTSRTSNPSCTVCKRHFRSPLLFLEHMQSQEHEQRVGEVCPPEGWPTQMEVALLEDIDEDEEYDPDTVYGSSFVVPVAGFLCRICQHFYHFESSARHSHCKSLKHFENLKVASSLSQQHLATTSTPTTTSTKGTLGQATPEQQSLAGPEDKEEEPTLDLGPVTEDTEEEPVTGETEEEAAAQEEKLGDGNAKGGSKRRSGRTTQRR
uniref:Cdkn1a interacting zinc finger protein 1a n=1 Tax=Oncorhynchus kisutch TaxID=8019 RepID=A0A8C7IHJ2_ONCKI